MPCSSDALWCEMTAEAPSHAHHFENSSKACRGQSATRSRSASTTVQDPSLTRAARSAER